MRTRSVPEFSDGLSRAKLSADPSQQSTVSIADVADIEELESLEDEVTRVYRPRAPRPGLTRRRARARARVGMVAALLALVILGLASQPPRIPVTSAARVVPTRATAPELLWGADPLATALRRIYLPSHSARPTTLGLDADTNGLPLKLVPFGGISVGEPHRGQLHGGVQLPENPGLYTLRRPEYAHGSTHAVMHLQIALAKFRRYSMYTGPLIVSDLSGPRGGYHWPHVSHQSGRDVDLWLPLRCDDSGVTLKGGDAKTGRIDFERFSAARPQEVDWAAAWELVKALVRTGQVEGIFLARPKHRFLRKAALRDGLTAQEADEIIQGEQKTLAALVRHVRGHDKHLHVRFRCADYETYCR
jgi:murein endopeptidase